MRLSLDGPQMSANIKKLMPFMEITAIKRISHWLKLVSKMMMMINHSLKALNNLEFRETKNLKLLLHQPRSSRKSMVQLTKSQIASYQTLMTGETLTDMILLLHSEIKDTVDPVTLFHLPKLLKPV